MRKRPTGLRLPLLPGPLLPPLNFELETLDFPPMPFDPTIPANHGPFSSADMRAQLNSLKALIDALQALVTAQQTVIADLQQQLAARPTAPEVVDLITAQAARNVDSVPALPPPWSENPPDRAEFNETRDKVNEVLSGLKHPA